MAYAVYETELTLLPDPVVELVARLECALRETDFKQVQLSFGLEPKRLPTVHVIVEVPDEFLPENRKEVENG